MKWTKERIKNYIQATNYECLDIFKDEYGKQGRTKWFCIVKCPNENHPSYEVAFDSFIRGYRCRKCADENNRTFKNEYKVIANIAYLIISNLKNNISKTYKFNIPHLEKVKKYHWYINGNGYARANGLNKSFSLHQLIVNNFTENVIDHKDRDITNNLDNNFRICTQHENSFNKSIQSNNTSGIIGVCKTRNDKWRAYIVKDNKQIHLGTFKNKHLAIIARLKAEKKLFKEFSPQQNLFEKYKIA